MQSSAHIRLPGSCGCEKPDIVWVYPTPPGAQMDDDGAWLQGRHLKECMIVYNALNNGYQSQSTSENEYSRI